MKKSLKGPILLALFGALLAGVAIFINREEETFAQYSERTTATFIADSEDATKVSREDTRTGKGTRFAYLISYTYEGETYETYLRRMTEGSSVPAPELGETTEIYIDTRDPDEIWDGAYVDERNTRFIITSAISFLFFLGSGVLFIKNRKENELY